MEKRTDYFSVNHLAPRDDEITVFFKKVTGSKSDGFAVVDNGKVFVIDVGKSGDTELINFLIDLRSKWLGEKILPDGQTAKLELTLFVSHAHPDHIGALPILLDDERFCVTEIYAPVRAYLSFDVPGALPILVESENKFESICRDISLKGHTAKGITRIPYGKVVSIQSGDADTGIKIYPSHIDWSGDYPSDKEGFKFIRSYESPTYKNCPEKGYANGILNGNSFWVKVSKGNHSVLITGDQRASDEMLGAMIRYYGKNEFDCDVLKLPHHGEKNYSPYLLDVAKPQFVVFTASSEKATPETVELCEKMGCTNYYICDGNLFFTVNQKEITAHGISPR